jgi:hypothetical protein
MVALPLGLFVIVAVLWTGAWFYASATAHTTIDAWRAHEASIGRFYNCGAQDIGGYPFRIEVDCAKPNAEWRSDRPPLAVTMKDLNVAAQIYDPTLLIADFTGPMMVGLSSAPPTVAVSWERAQASIRGLPTTGPGRVSSVFDKVAIARVDGGRHDLVAQADHFEVHGRTVAGTSPDNPAIEVVVRADAASSSEFRVLAEPISGEITAMLWGLHDLSPKSWTDRLRDLQAAGGHIDIKQARVQQANSIIVGNGTLALNARGQLEGQLQLTIVGLDHLLSGLDLDRVAAQLVPQDQLDRIAPGLDASKLSQSLDRIMPGLGGAVRNNSGAIAAAGVAAMGQPTQLEGKPAVMLPLRFADGTAYLGQLRIGPTPPLF